MSSGWSRSSLVELRVREPLIDMRLLASRGVWPANLVGLAFGFLMFGTFLVVPTLLEMPEATGYGFGQTITEAGLFLLPTTADAHRLRPRGGHPRPPVRREAAAGPRHRAGTAAYALPALAHDQLWQHRGVRRCSAAPAIGLVFAAMSNAIIAAVPATHTGQATSVNAIVRTVGGSIGTAVVAAVIASDTTAQGIPSDHAFTLGFAVCAAVGVLAVLAPRSPCPAAAVATRHPIAVELEIQDIAAGH